MPFSEGEIMDALIKKQAFEEAEREIKSERFDMEVQRQKVILKNEKKKKPFFKRMAEVLNGEPIVGASDLPEEVQIGIYDEEGVCLKTYIWDKGTHVQNVTFEVWDGSRYVGEKTIRVDIRRIKEED